MSVSFFGRLGLRRISAPDLASETAIQVASLLDIAGCKMAVVQKRAEAKDYRDVTALLENGITLPMALAAARAIFGPLFDPATTLRALSYFADGDLPKLPRPAQDALRIAAAGVKLSELPVLEGSMKLALPGRQR